MEISSLLQVEQKKRLLHFLVMKGTIRAISSATCQFSPSFTPRWQTRTLKCSFPFNQTPQLSPVFFSPLCKRGWNDCLKFTGVITTKRFSFWLFSTFVKCYSLLWCFTFAVFVALKDKRIVNNACLPFVFTIAHIVDLYGYFTIVFYTGLRC